MKVSKKQLQRKTTDEEQILKLNNLLKELNLPVSLLSREEFHDMHYRGMGDEVYEKSKKHIDKIGGIYFANYTPLEEYPAYLGKDHTTALNFHFIKNTLKSFSYKEGPLSLQDLYEIQVLIFSQFVIGDGLYEIKCDDPACLLQMGNLYVHNFCEQHFFICCPCKQHPLPDFNKIKNKLSKKYGEAIIWGDTAKKRKFFAENTRLVEAQI